MFIDFVEAFDLVDQSVFWKKIILGCPIKIGRLIVAFVMECKLELSATALHLPAFQLTVTPSRDVFFHQLHLALFSCVLNDAVEDQQSGIQICLELAVVSSTYVNCKPKIGLRNDYM